MMKWNRRAEYASALERAETRRRPEAESLRYKFSLREKKKKNKKQEETWDDEITQRQSKR